MDLRELWLEGMKWIHVVQNSNMLRAVKVVMNPGVPEMAENVLAV